MTIEEKVLNDIELTEEEVEYIVKYFKCFDEKMHTGGLWDHFDFIFTIGHKYFLVCYDYTSNGIDFEDYKFWPQTATEVRKLEHIEVKYDWETIK